jgi:hypothetical protein
VRGMGEGGGRGKMTEELETKRGMGCVKIVQACLSCVGP